MMVQSESPSKVLAGVWLPPASEVKWFEGAPMHWKPKLREPSLINQE